MLMLVVRINASCVSRCVRVTASVFLYFCAAREREKKRERERERGPRPRGFGIYGAAISFMGRTRDGKQKDHFAFLYMAGVKRGFWLSIVSRDEKTRGGEKNNRAESLIASRGQDGGGFFIDIFEKTPHDIKLMNA